MSKQISKFRFSIDIIVLLVFFGVVGISIFYYLLPESTTKNPTSSLENATPAINLKQLIALSKNTLPAPVSKEWIPVSLSNRWQYITIHHSATASGNATIFDKNHKQAGFENGLGYHFVICNGNGEKDGFIEIGERWKNQIKGGHLKGDKLDEISIGICLVGDFTISMPTANQIASLKSLLLQLQTITNISDSNIISHKKMPGQTTACPGLLPVKEIVKFKQP